MDPPERADTHRMDGDMLNITARQDLMRIIFDTLNEELEARKNRAPKNLSEVTSKNSQLILKSNKPAESSVQEQVSNRMKKLAGLI